MLDLAGIAIFEPGRTIFLSVFDFKLSLIDYILFFLIFLLVAILWFIWFITYYLSGLSGLTAYLVLSGHITVFDVFLFLSFFY